MTQCQAEQRLLAKKIKIKSGISNATSWSEEHALRNELCGPYAAALKDWVYFDHNHSHISQHCSLSFA